MEKHRIAVTVFVEAEGVDRLDASHIGALAVRMSLIRQMNANHELSFTDRYGRTYTVPMHGVMETGMAAGNGYLWVEPTSKAYPRDDEPEEGQ
jgi:hypothetical protein